GGAADAVWKKDAQKARAPLLAGAQRSRPRVRLSRRERLSRGRRHGATVHDALGFLSGFGAGFGLLALSFASLFASPFESLLLSAGFESESFDEGVDG